MILNLLLTYDSTPRLPPHHLIIKIVKNILRENSINKINFALSIFLS